MTRKFLQEENSRTVLTINDAPIQEGRKFPQYLAASLATLSAFVMGTCIAWSSSAIPMLLKPDSTLLVTLDECSWIASLITLGAFFGAIPAGTLAAAIGSKKLLLVLAVPTFSSWLIIAYSNVVWGFYFARFMTGLSIGAVSVAAPMYVAELAECSIRGTLGTFFQLQITIGLLFGYTIGGFISSFQLLALTSSVLPVVFLLLFSFMPESPVYLISKGKTNDARKSLQWFRGVDYDVEEELTQLNENIREATANRAKLSDLINSKATSKGLIISLGLMVFQQLSGINAVLFYASAIFQESGSTMSPNLSTIVIGAVQVVATYVSTILIDRAGRKILLLVSSSVMCICLVLLGIYFNVKEYHDLSYLSVLPLISLAIFIIVFSIGFGPIPWMIMGEIFQPNVKGMASSVSAAFNWILAFTVTKLFQNMINVLGTGVTFIIFGVICGIGTIFVLLIVPETKGKSINEVQILLMGQKLETGNKTMIVGHTSNVAGY